MRISQLLPFHLLHSQAHLYKKILHRNYLQYSSHNKNEIPALLPHLRLQPGLLSLRFLFSPTYQNQSPFLPHILQA